jgi:hypothetical protein
MIPPSRHPKSRWLMFSQKLSWAYENQQTTRLTILCIQLFYFAKMNGVCKGTNVLKRITLLETGA